jgi:hypothetical protein
VEVIKFGFVLGWMHDRERKDGCFGLHFGKEGDLYVSEVLCFSVDLDGRGTWIWSQRLNIDRCV